eukprot:scaffold337979_cov52-Prasinocladus_malaysianus.AAC.1
MSSGQPLASSSRASNTQTRAASSRTTAGQSGRNTVKLNLDGQWTKNTKKSELGTYDRALDLMGIRGIQKKTAQLIDGIELS